MLRIAHEEAKAHKVDGVCEFKHANFLDLATDEKFDVVFAMGVFDYLPDPAPFLNKMSTMSRGKVIASFPLHSLVREPARRLRYLATGRGDVHFYSEREVQDLASGAKFKRSHLVPIHSSGRGVVLVGDNT
jgi:trans-aconitate methyltransferase